MPLACGSARLPKIGALRFGVACSILAFAFAGCSHVSREPVRTAAKPPRAAAGDSRVHVVKRGETLYKIAWQHGIDQRDLARWNRLRNPDVIHVGQRLRLTPPGRAGSAAASASTTRSARRSAPAAPARAAPPAPAPPPPVWQWPANGTVVTRFGTAEGIATGIGIRGQAGQPIYASAPGRVVYAGGGLIGYGQLLIIKHDDTYLTAYGYLSRLLVSEGQDVARGQTIAQMGTGPGRQPRLHFEIRRDGVPVDPLQYFPGR